MAALILFRAPTDCLQAVRWLGFQAAYWLQSLRFFRLPWGEWAKASCIAKRSCEAKTNPSHSKKPFDAMPNGFVFSGCLRVCSKVCPQDCANGVRSKAARLTPLRLHHHQPATTTPSPPRHFSQFPQTRSANSRPKSVAPFLSRCSRRAGCCLRRSGSILASRRGRM